MAWAEKTAHLAHASHAPPVLNGGNYTLKLLLEDWKRQGQQRGLTLHLTRQPGTATGPNIWRLQETGPAAVALVTGPGHNRMDERIPSPSPSAAGLFCLSFFLHNHSYLSSHPLPQTIPAPQSPQPRSQSLRSGVSYLSRHMQFL